MRMYEAHPSFTTPNHDQVIWKYFDYAKFSSMILNKALFFTTVTQFEDPYESTYPPSHYRFEEMANRLISEGSQVNQEKLIKILKHNLTIFQNLRSTYAANCWHQNSAESDAFWKIYSGMNHGIAVRSSVGRLIKSFEAYSKRSVFIGSVKYLNFETEMIDTTNGFTAPLTKRHVYVHEQELRAIIWGLNIDIQANPSASNVAPFESKAGELVEIDLKTLIEEIKVSPLAPLWFTDTVRKFLELCKISVPVNKSTLLDPPTHLFTRQAL